MLRLDVARALGDFGDGKSRGPLRERLESDLDPRVKRRIRETLRDLAEPKRPTEALRDEIDRLQTEHAELKSRLSKLEARLEVERGTERSTTTARHSKASADSRKKKKKKARKGKGR
jgi:aminopeptidase N